MVCLRLTKPAGNVFLGPFIMRRVEHDLGLVKLDDLSQQEKRGLVGYPGRLLHVVRHHDYRVFFLELYCQILYLRR